MNQSFVKKDFYNEFYLKVLLKNDLVGNNKEDQYKEILDSEFERLKNFIRERFIRVTR